MTKSVNDFETLFVIIYPLLFWNQSELFLGSGTVKADASSPPVPPQV